MSALFILEAETSSLHQDHVSSFHHASRKITLDIWKSNEYLHLIEADKKHVVYEKDSQYSYVSVKKDDLNPEIYNFMLDDLVQTRMYVKEPFNLQYIIIQISQSIRLPCLRMFLQRLPLDHTLPF